MDERRSFDAGSVMSPDSVGARPAPKNRRASITIRRDEDKQLDALRYQDVEIEADSAAFRALDSVPDGKNASRKSMFPSAVKKKKGLFGKIFNKEEEEEEDMEEDEEDEYEHPTIVEGRKNVQDRGNYLLTIGMVYGIRTMTGRRDFFHSLLEHNSYFYDSDSDDSAFDSDDTESNSGEDDDSIEEERRRRRKIKSRHRKFSEGLKSLFGFSSGHSDIVRKRYKNSNSGTSYAYKYKRSHTPRAIPDSDSQDSNIENVEITEEDFTYEIEVTFPPEGSPGPPFPTPEHKLHHPFKFKDYMPNAFRAVRHLSGISEIDYIQSVANPNLNYIEFLANSKSGQFFFYSHDRKYMIKTMTKAESQYLRKIFPDYLRHLNNNPNSLIVRFYGMHRVKMRFLESRIYFVIMSSVFDTDLPIHAKYDLKGSSIGRHVPRKLCKDVDVVKKDLNLVEDGRRFYLGKDNAKRLAETLKSDSRFLRKLNIMDYSLLVGVHEMDTTNNEIDYEDSESSSIYRVCHGGIRGDVYEDGRQDVYFLGIIDILTLYSFAKKAETIFKSLTGVDVRELSAVDPDWYAERFQKFVLHYTDYEKYFGKRIKERERQRKEKLLLRQSEQENEERDRRGSRGSSLKKGGKKSPALSPKSRDSSPSKSESYGRNSGSGYKRADSVGSRMNLSSNRDDSHSFGYYAANAATPLATESHIRSPNQRPAMEHSASIGPGASAAARREMMLGHHHLRSQEEPVSVPQFSPRFVSNPDADFAPQQQVRPNEDFTPTNGPIGGNSGSNSRSSSAPRGARGDARKAAAMQYMQGGQAPAPSQAQYDDANFAPPPRVRGSAGALRSAPQPPNGNRRRDDLL